MIRLVHFPGLTLATRNGEIGEAAVAGVYLRTLALELSYLTSKIRSAATDGKAARKMLGDDLARSFHSIVADIRDAMYMGEVPGTQEIELATGKIGLNYLLGHLAVLEVEPMGSAPNDAHNWRQVHRVRLLRIVQNGKVLV